MHIECVDNFIKRVCFPNVKPSDSDFQTEYPSKEIYPVLFEAAGFIEDYFLGKFRDWRRELILEGSDFDRSVWDATRRIGAGSTVTYGGLAAAIGKPNAARAAGNALGRNPLPIIIPCHRVIGANGKLRGFGGGLAVKEWLLLHEKMENE